MKTIGLLGGMSWESTVPYYQAINRTVAQRLGGLHSARLLLYSVDFHEIERLQHEGAWQQAGAQLAEIAATLETAGADFVVLCTNTMHKVADAIESRVRIPLLHIADPTADAIARAGHRRAGLIGTRFTMEEAFYTDRLRARGIEAIVPSASDREIVHAVIYDELCRGVIAERSRAEYRRIMAQLVHARGGMHHPRVHRDLAARRGRRRFGGQLRHHGVARACRGAVRARRNRLAGGDVPSPIGERRADGEYFAASADRNKEPILEVLRRVLPRTGVVLEIASGTGQHAVHFAHALAPITWQPTEIDPALHESVRLRVEAARLPNLRPPVFLDVGSPAWPIARADAIVCINMIHVAPWETTLALLDGAARTLVPGGVLFLYGAYRRDGRHTAPSNAQFDAALHANDPRWGVRDLGEVGDAAKARRLDFIEAVEMPSNNLSVVFQRGAGAPLECAPQA